MCAKAKPRRAGLCLSATARYVPFAYQPFYPTALYSAATPKDVLMRALYADTLRWSGACTVLAPTRAPAPTRDEAPGRVAIETHLSLSEMAVIAARAAIERAPSLGESTIGQIIVCTTSLEHDLALSCAGRLHREIGSARSPFAIGGLQAASFLLALQIAHDMMTVDTQARSVLIVAAERWRLPFQRAINDQAVLGDGAAAALLQRSTRRGWYVCGVSTTTPAAVVEPAAKDYIDESAMKTVVAKTCKQAGVCPADVDWSVPARIGEHRARALSARLGLAPERIWYPAPGGAGHLCAADTPAQLDTLLCTITPHDSQHILVWSVGFQGQAACAMLVFREH